MSPVFTFVFLYTIHVVIGVLRHCRVEATGLACTVV